jgi:hypothetical protein
MTIKEVFRFMSYPNVQMFLSLFNDTFQLHSYIAQTVKNITVDGKDFKGDTIPAFA